MANDYKTLLTELGFYPSRSEAISESMTEADIQRIEQKLGCPLLQDYRQFLGEYSDLLSGHTYFSFSTEDGEEDGVVHGLYGHMKNRDLADKYFSLRQALQADENYNLENYSGLRWLRDIDASQPQIGWPEELMAIGTDPGNNEICVALKGLRPGAIFYWRVNPLPDEENLYLVANSFDDFVHMLKKESV